MRGNHYYRKIGEKIAYFRKKINLSQYQLADKAKVNRGHLAVIEKGKGNPTVKFLGKISRVMGVKVKELFEDV